MLLIGAIWSIKWDVLVHKRWKHKAIQNCSFQFCSFFQEMKYITYLIVMFGSYYGCSFVVYYKNICKIKYLARKNKRINQRFSVGMISA